MSKEVSGKPTVINIAQYQDKEQEERKKFFLEQLEELKQVIEDDRMTNFILEWECKPLDTDDQDLEEGHMVFWNVEENIDVTIGKCARLQNRLILLAEGILTGQE